MNDSIVFRLEDLPVEILSEIFQYFDIYELYASFSSLNTRLDSILRSLSNLNLITTSHSDPVLSFFNSFSTVQLHFNYSRLSSLCQFNFSSFIGTRAFIIYPPTGLDNYTEPIEQLERFIRPDLCPQLQCLRLPYCSQRLAYWIFNGAFPHLKRCHLYDDTYSRIVLSSLTNNSVPTLRQLTVQKRHGNEFEKILLLCPNLSYLDFSCDSVLPPFEHLNSSYSSLKRLRLFRIRSFLFHHNDQFDSLLSFFPNLIDFYLTVDQCPVYNETIDFYRIAQYLFHRVPHLRVLNLRIYVTIRNRSSFSRHSFKQISQTHPLFKCFGRTGCLVHISSVDFTAIYYYDLRFDRPSSE